MPMSRSADSAASSFDVDGWLDGQPSAIAPQVAIIRRLLEAARADDRIRLLVIGCSIGRGAADRLSDIDALIAVDAERWESFRADEGALLRRLSALADAHVKTVEAGDGDYRLAWALYADGVQLELVITRAKDGVRAASDWVVLHDPDGRVRGERLAHAATRTEVDEWAYDAWSSLLLCAKYVRRGSLWEALETLHAARTRLWRLWAVSRRVGDPQYGLTAVFEAPGVTPPRGIEATHPALNARSITAAALACAELVEGAWADATRVTSGSSAELPAAAQAVRRELRALTDAHVAETWKGAGPTSDA